MDFCHVIRLTISIKIIHYNNYYSFFYHKRNGNKHNTILFTQKMKCSNTCLSMTLPAQLVSEMISPRQVSTLPVFSLHFRTSAQI